jgi:hypothetical protein
MRRIRAAAGGFALALAMLLVPSTATAENFHAYVSCGVKAKHPAAFCFEGDHTTAVFRSREEAKVVYKLCTRKAGERKRCRQRRTRGAGKPSRTRFDIDGAGKYKLAWTTDGRIVERAKLVVRNRSALVIGDSLGEGTRPYMPGALRGWSVSQDVDVSRFVPGAVSILRGRGGLPSVIVMSVGTNDDPNAVESFRNNVEATLAIAGKTRCVVWPNIVRPPVGGRSYAGYNQVLAEMERRRDNFRVVDWVKIVSRNRGWLAGDGVHVNATGYQARANAIAKQVERC